jgi:hypothetical protein
MAMTETATTTATTDPAVELGSDGTPFNAERAMTTIRAMREQDKQLRARNTLLETAVKTLASGKELPGLVEPGAAPADSEELLALRQTTLAMGALLGLTPEQIAAPTGPESLLNSLRDRAIISPAIDRAAVALGADVALLKPLLTASGKLSDVDPAHADAAVTELVKAAIAAHPQLKRNTAPLRSGMPIPAGSGGATSIITRDHLALMTPGQIHAARVAGLLTHLDVGPGEA